MMQDISEAEFKQLVDLAYTRAAIIGEHWEPGPFSYTKRHNSSLSLSTPFLCNNPWIFISGGISEEVEASEEIEETEEASEEFEETRERGLVVGKLSFLFSNTVI